MSKEALKLAVDAGYKDLPTVRLAYQGFDIQHFTNLVIAAERHRVLAEERAALAQPEQEPVAEITVKNGHWIDTTGFAAVKNLADGLHKLYTTPPQQKPLTEEEMEKIATEYWLYPRKFVRAIEAAHGIKE